MDEQNPMTRLMALDPTLTLGEAANALSQESVPRMTARCEAEDGTLLAGVVFMRGSSAETYIAALDAMDEDGTLLGRIDDLKGELDVAAQEAGKLRSLSRQRQEQIEEQGREIIRLQGDLAESRREAMDQSHEIKAQAREIKGLQHEVASWRGA